MAGTQSLDVTGASSHLLVPTDADCTAYEGFLTLPQAGQLNKSMWMRISGLQSNVKNLQDARLEVSEELADLFKDHEPTVRARLRDSATLSVFLMELTTLAQHLLDKRPPLDVPAPQFYGRLLEDIAAVGWDTVLFMSPHLDELHLSLTDAAGRQHQVALRLPPSYPADAPSVSIDLPEPPRLSWDATSASLGSIMDQCGVAVDAMHDVWHCLDDLDRHAWVLEPEKPSRADVFRRIAVGQHCSMNLTLDVHHPRGFPQYSLMGGDAPLADLRTRLHGNRGLWDESRMPRENLESLLGHQLPARQAIDLDDASLNCCICYAYRLTGSDGQPGPPPDVNCNNGPCSRPFHRTCLLEWLQAVPTTRKSFNMLFGQCPFCDSSIAVRALGGTV